MIQHKTGDLFTAAPESYLVHACNCKGMWGSGVALTFKEKFPKSYEVYHMVCENGVQPGDVLVCAEENGFQVVCLFTSKDYGAHVDSPEKILDATAICLQKMPIDKPINMPLINSDRFKVPWEQTQALLSQYDDLDITVWSLK